MTLTVAIFNATGAQGAPVVSAAQDAGHRVRAVARDAASITSRHGSAVEAVEADFDDRDSLLRAFEGVDAAFAHLPIPADMHTPARQLGNLLAAAQQAGLPLLVWSTSGPTGARWGDSPAANANEQVAQAVLASGVPSIVLQPTVYLENLQTPLMASRLGEGVLDYPPLSPLRRLSWTSHTDQARLAAAALARPELAGRRFDIATGQAITGGELAVLLQGWAGRPLRYEPMTPQAFGQRLSEAFGSPPIGAAIGALYQALDAKPLDETVVDATVAAQAMGVNLPSLEAIVAAWPLRNTDA